MKKNWMLISLIVIALIAIMIYSLPSREPDTAAYAAAIEKERLEKDEFMRQGDGSPFADDSNAFVALKYFPPNLTYRIQAQLEPIGKKDITVLSTSDGNTKSYLPYAHAVFDWDGAENRLLILEVMDPGPFRGTLFLAFADGTSANETYGAGRYLDVKKVAGATTVVLDFNKAYNPYCAYADNFSCPLPPKENILRFRVEAGEKSYSQH